MKATTMTPIKIRLEDIATLTYSTRTHTDPRKLELMAQSIRTRGDVERPILVTERQKHELRSIDNPTGRQYVVVCGLRRRDAAKLAGLREVSAMIEQLDEPQAIERSLMDNIEQEELSSIDRTRFTLMLLKNRLVLPDSEIVSLLSQMHHLQRKRRYATIHSGEYGGAILKTNVSKIEQTFDELNWITWQSFLTHKLPLLELPQEVQRLLQTKQVSFEIGRWLSKLGANERNPLIEKIETKKVMTRALRTMMIERENERKNERHRTPNATPEQFEQTAQRLSAIAAALLHPQQHKNHDRRWLEKLEEHTNSLEQMTTGQPAHRHDATARAKQKQPSSQPRTPNRADKTGAS